MRKFVAVPLMLAFSGLIALTAVGADDKPKWNTKEVMKLAHKDGLLKKVTEGKGSKDDASMLLALYEAMAANKPPMGDAAAWKAKNDAILAATKDLVAGKDGAATAVTKATNCAACHKDHKPPAPK